MARSEKYTVEIAATDSASSTIEQVAAARDKLSDAPVVVDITADDEASEAIEEVTADAATLDGTEADVELGADDEATEVVEEVAGATGDLDGQAAEVDLSADDQATPTVEEATTAVETFDGVTGDAELTAIDATDDGIGAATDSVGAFDSADASASLTATDDTEDGITTATETVGGFDSESASASLDASDDTEGGLTEAATSLSDWESGSDSNATATIDATDEATPDIEAVSGELTTLSEESGTPDITIEGDDAADVTAVSEALGDLSGESATASMEVTGAGDAAGDMSSVVGDLTTIGAGFLTGLATGKLENVFGAASEHVLDVQTLAGAIGSSLEDASGISEQFDFVGVSAQKLQTMIEKVNDKIRESPGLAEELGITIGENQSPLDTFVSAVDALNSGQLTANDRIRIGTEVFGRKGLNSVLAIDTQVGNLGDAIDNLPDWQVVTQADIDSAISFKQTMDEIGDLAAEAGQQFLTAFGPGITDFFHFLEDTGGRINTVFQAGMEGSTRSVFDFFNSLDSRSMVEINDAFLDLSGTTESLRDNFFNAQQAADLLDLGVPPEVIASAKLTGGAYELLGQRMSEDQATAERLQTALENNQISQQNWQTITADGVITAGELNEILGGTAEELDGTSERAEAFAAAQAQAKADADKLTDALTEQITELEASEQAHKDTAEAIQDAADGFLTEREALRDAEDAVDNYHDSLKPVEDDTRSAEQVTRDQERALDAVVTAYEGAADAAVEHARETRAAEGATLSEVDALDIHNDSLLENARTLNGTERTAILQHILRLNGIPEARITEITADTNPDALADTERELNNASRARQALIAAALDAYAQAVAEQQLAQLARTRYATVVSTVVTRSGGFELQHGSPHTSRGLTLVGEGGPELVEMPEGATVHTAEETLAFRRHGIGGGEVHYHDHTTNYLPAGTPRATVKSLRRYKRRNGQLEGVS